jgi:hypothetical protein
MKMGTYKHTPNTRVSGVLRGDDASTALRFKVRPPKDTEGAIHTARQLGRGAVRSGEPAAKAASSTGEGMAVLGAGAALGAGSAAMVAGLSPSDKVDERLEKLESRLGFGGMIGMMIPQIVGFLGGGVKKIGGWMGAGFLERGGEATQKSMEALGEATFGSASKRIGVSGMFSRIAQPIANTTGAVFDTTTRWTGLHTWRANANAKKAAAVHSKAAEVAADMRKNMRHAPSEISAHLNDMLKAAEGHHTQLDSHAVQAGKNALDKGLSGIKNKPAFSKETKALLGQAEKLAAHLDDAAHFGDKAKGWKDVRKAISDVPGKISGAQLVHTAANAAFIAQGGVSLLRDGHSFAHDTAVVNKMEKDVSALQASSPGGREASGMRAMLSGIRKKLALKAVLTSVLDGAQIALQVARIGPGKQIFGFLATSMASDFIKGHLKTDETGMYEAMSKAQAKGQPLTAQDYAMFITANSKDIQSRGDDGAVYAQALGAQYAAEKASPAKIVSDINGTEFMDRLHKAVAANEAKAPKATHVDRLNGAAATAQPVKGKHTQKIMDTTLSRGASAPSPTV